MNYFSGLQPADIFTVSTNYVSSALSEEVLRRLYIPLIGLESIAIYQYLEQFVMDTQKSDDMMHYIILNELKMNLSRFEKLRQQLEAIGLIKTYMKVDDNEQRFIYKLLSPVMPVQFFNDPMLSVFLYQVVGKERFQFLKQYFSTETSDTSGYQDVSKNYMDVFGTPKAPTKEIYEGNEHLVKMSDAPGIPVHQQHFDFDLLEMLLSQNLISANQLSKETRELIAQLSLLYDITPTDMRRIILKSLTSDQTIAHEELRKNARDFYQIEHDGKLPELKVVPDKEDVNEKTSLSWFEMMDTTSPIEMLASMSQSEPTTKQKRMIEMILEREKLPFGVMNILLQYVLFTNEMKLPQSYIEEIASNWKKLKLDSSKSAYDYVKKMQTNQAVKKEQRQTKYRETKSYEMTPEWIKAMEQKDNKTSSENKDSDSEDIDKQRREIEAQLKNFWREDK